MNVVQQMAWRSELRGAIHRADGRAVVALLGTGAPSEDALQLIGDGLILALAQQVKGTLEPAAKCAEALRLRDWTGDSVLAERLDALLGSGPTPMLRYVPVDLEELADVLEGDPLDGGGRLDRQSGEVWPHAAIENARDMGEEDEDESDDTQRWLWIRSHGSRAGYQDMRDFIGTVRDTRRADRLEIAI